MRTIQSIFTVVLFFGVVSAAVASDGWLTSFDEAKKEASKRNVPIFADFSGSDWCGWCIRFDKEILNTEAFKEYAKKHLVLLSLDFPHGKAQSAELKKQNQELAKKYAIGGFPTVILLNKDGDVIDRTGYKSGGPEKYIKHLEEILKKAKK